MHQISAADYDPSLDRREDHKRAQEQAAPQNVEIEEEEEEDVEDMFAITTASRKVKKVKKIVVSVISASRTGVDAICRTVRLLH